MIENVRWSAAFYWEVPWMLGCSERAVLEEKDSGTFSTWEKILPLTLPPHGDK